MVFFMDRAILLLEGGAFRTLYTAGVLDVLMEHNIELDVAGVSGGALTGINYISKQPDRSRSLNMGYRFDPNYVGAKAIPANHGIFGFDYLFNGTMNDNWPLDREAFFHSPQKYYAAVTNCETGLTELLDRDELGEEIFTAAKASSSLPLLAEAVRIGSHTYLDGGLSAAIPLHWAIQKGYEKIVVVRTRDRSYRKPPLSKKEAVGYTLRFSTKPMLREDLMTVPERYNRLAEELLELEESGRIFVLAPEEPVTATRLEGDLVTLQQLYNTACQETEGRLEALKSYLES
jgi:predicted patatin/cPLA2 family phospholipase